MNVSTWVPSAATTDLSPHTVIRSNSMKAFTTSAMALFSFSIVTCRRAVVPNSCADTFGMCRGGLPRPNVPQFVIAYFGILITRTELQTWTA